MEAVTGPTLGLQEQRTAVMRKLGIHQAAARVR
jgi:hypothetical protein